MRRTKKIYKKVIIEVVVFATVFALLAPLATTVLEASEVQDLGPILTKSFDEAKPTREQLESIGLSEEDIDLLLNADNTGITLHDGIAYDENGNRIEEQVGISLYGKFSWAAKAILKAYNKAPAPVKNFINRFIKIGGLLGLINHFTGTVEDAIYWACISVGMPSWMAWTVAKALTLFL